MKIILGIVGQNGAGKGTLVNTLQQKAIEEGFSVGVHSSYRTIADLLEMCTITPSRENAQKFVEIMENNLKKGFLSDALGKRMSEDKSDLVIFDCLRMPTDITMFLRLRESNPNTRIFIANITRDREKRFAGLKARGQKPGEKDMTWEQFLMAERAHTEIHIPEIAKRADLTIENNGSLQEYEKKIDALFSDTIATSLEQQTAI